MSVLLELIEETQKTNTSSKKNAEKNPEILRLQKIKTRKVPSLKSNLEAIESARKRKFLSQFTSINLQNSILKPETVEALYHLSFSKGIDKEYVRDLIRKSILNAIQESEKTSLLDLFDLASQTETEKNFVNFMEAYSNVKHKENPPEASWIKLQEIINIIPFYTLEKETIKILTNKANPIPATFPKNKTKTFFTEECPLKAYLMQKSTNSEKIEDVFLYAIKDIKDNSIDITILFLEEKEIKMENKEDIIAIRRATQTKGIIKDGYAKNSIASLESAITKTKNNGILIAQGNATLMIHQKINIKKHRKVAVPVISILSNTDGKNKKTILVPAVNLKTGKIEEIRANETLSVFCVMDYEEFMNSPLKQEYTPLYTEDFQDLNSKLIQERIKDFELITKQKAINTAKTYLLKTIKSLHSEFSLKNKTLITTTLKNIEKEVEKKSVNTLEKINALAEKTGRYIGGTEKIKRNLLIAILSEKRERPISPIKEKRKKELTLLAERLFKKITGNDILTLYHISIVGRIMSEDKEIFALESSRAAKMITNEQTKFIKPFEFVLSKEDFISLILHQAFPNNTGYMEKQLKTYLKNVEKIKSNKQTHLENATKEVLNLINKATNKNFKKLREALRYVFSENFPGKINRKNMLIEAKKAQYDVTRYFSQILDMIGEGYGKTILETNTMHKIYKEIPGIIQKIKTLFYYIENKENAVSKISVRKTLEKINAVEEELQLVKS